MIIGVDEVGRGCIAGDLLVCAFAVLPGISSEHRAELQAVAMDSKAFKSRKGRLAADAICRKHGVFEMRRASPERIDELNIRGATLWAMREASQALAKRLDAPVEILFDGKDVPEGIGYPARAVIKGDASIIEISAASIIAKVARDTELDQAALTYPGYGFEKHAGYGTKAHRAAIAKLGLCPIHRSWAEKFLPA